MRITQKLIGTLGNRRLHFRSMVSSDHNGSSSKCKKLHLFNSLTHKKELFKPQKNKTVTWYCCGPTVYDSAHMGHARSYISFDIIRRVLIDYFHYNVIYVMNVTDIDDKIITKARKDHLWKEFRETTHSLSQVIQILKESIENFETKIHSTADPDVKNMRIQRLETVKSKFSQMNLLTDEQEIIRIKDEFKDVLSDYLDFMKGNTVTDQEIFSKLSRKYENEFIEDIKALGIMLPTFMPRVSECIDDIIKYISIIMENGYAYASNGSVYFDVVKFGQIHKYAKLMPSAAEDLSSLAVGEGELSAAIDTQDKRSPRDFALWKSSKPGEPSWSSPWGQGRPGWHIECSTMCHNIMPNKIDIHSGGVDLKFPHHDNEMAQSEAYYKCNDWVTYFLHTGHLTIEGCKMSKSLKNFVSIRDALKNYSARQIRLAFIMHQWNGPLDFSTNVMNDACVFDRKLSLFITRLSALIRESAATSVNNVYGEHEQDLQDKLIDAHDKIHSAICDNIDTPSVVLVIKQLVSSTNTYIATKGDGAISHFLLLSIKNYVIETLSLFGADFHEHPMEQESLKDSEFCHKLAKAVANFRNDVRNVALSSKDHDILSLCDILRDTTLFDLGIKLEDKGVENMPTVIITTRDQLIKEREEVQRAQKIKQSALTLEKDRQKQILERKSATASIHPSKLFINETSKYSKFDENGIPLMDNEGKPISKSAMKKIIKRYNEQKIIHDKYLQSKE